MICKYIARRLSAIDLKPEYKKLYYEELNIIREKYAKNSLEKNFLLKKICFKYILLCEDLISIKYLAETRKIIEFIKETILEIYEKNTTEIYLIKIKAYLLTLKWHDLNGSSIEKSDFLDKIKLFLNEIEQDEVCQLIKNDYYSHIERLYLNLIKKCLQEKKYIECKEYLTKCYDSIKSQVMLLNEELELYQQKKIFQILEIKVRLFVQLFDLDFCYQKRYQVEIINSHVSFAIRIYQKYQKVIDKLPNLVNRDDVIKKYQDLDEKAQSEYAVVIKQVPEETKQHVKTNKFGRSTSLIQNIKQSFKFISEFDKNNNKKDEVQSLTRPKSTTIERQLKNSSTSMKNIESKKSISSKMHLRIQKQINLKQIYQQNQNKGIIPQFKELKLERHLKGNKNTYKLSLKERMKNEQLEEIKKVNPFKQLSKNECRDVVFKNDPKKHLFPQIMIFN